MVIEELNSDKDSKEYLGDLFYAIKKNEKRKNTDIMNINKTFIPYYNDYPIGYFAIYNKNSEYQISYGILKSIEKRI